MRHRSGRYYARVYANGKEVWEPLKTSHFKVAQAKLAAFLKDHTARASVAPGSEFDARLSFGTAMKTHIDSLRGDRDLKPSTLHYWGQIFAALVKSWPELAATEIRKINVSDCALWAERFGKKSSATRFNNTLGGMRRVFRVAIEAGIIFVDPTAKLKRVRVRAKQLKLPSRKQFTEIIEKVSRAGGWCSRACADLIQGMAFTGIRKGEAAEVEWGDFSKSWGELIVRGDPETGTKNWEVRRVPLIPAARELFERIRAERPTEKPTEKVFKVIEAQKALDSACRKVGVARITHHDLRHLFATTCIESGIDIPTVSRWLGHKDGGALAMKTYGHLRDDHSKEQALRVNFS
ncbi:MAG TPA: site-specific integrase [Chthoniobacterales bacterium]